MCYILSNSNNKSYIGCTNNITRRLRQHNGEIVGGAKYTTKFGVNTEWKPLLIIEGFEDKSTALSFEWRMKRKKNKYGKLKPLSGAKARVDNVFNIIENDIITSKSIKVSDIKQLVIKLNDNYYDNYKDYKCNNIKIELI